MGAEAPVPQPEQISFADGVFTYGWLAYYNDGLPGHTPPSGYHYSFSFDTGDGSLRFRTYFPTEKQPDPLIQEVGSYGSVGIESDLGNAGILEQFARLVSDAMSDRVDSYDRVLTLREELEEKIRNVGKRAGSRVGQGGYKSEHWDGIHQQVSDKLQGFTL